MKKILTSLALVSTLAVFGQKVNYGIKGGVNLSSLNVKNNLVKSTVNSTGRTGFYVGFSSEFPLSAASDKLFGQIEALYIQNGGKLSTVVPRYDRYGDITSYKTFDMESRIQQINMPIVLKYEIVQGLRLNAGGYLGFILSAETRDDDDINWSKDDGYKTVDAGLIFGTEYNFPQGLFVDARYNLGLANISDTNLVPANNRGFQFGLGYKF